MVKTQISNGGVQYQIQYVQKDWNRAKYLWNTFRDRKGRSENFGEGLSISKYRVDRLIIANKLNIVKFKNIV